MSCDTETSYVDYTLDLVSYNSDRIKTKMYKPKNSEVEYKILNYDDQVICDNDMTNGLYRSVILDPETNQILSFTPPKTMTLDYFKEQHPIITENILVNEIVEGTMITLFYDHRINSWEIASKGAVGCNYWFFRTQYAVKDMNQITFRKMFLEAFRAADDQDINDLVCLKDFPKDCCYNFILQHPENHIVLQIPSPVVYLVSVYKMTGDKVTAIPHNVYENWDCFCGLQGLIEFPRKFVETCYDELEKNYCTVNSPYNMVGIMFTNIKTGMMAVLENPTYREVRLLRGNNPNLQYQYLCLLKMGKVMEFLNYFPQYKNVFYRFYKDFQQFITNTHQCYISYYVKKSGEKISKKYFPLIYKLHHEVFLPSLKAQERIIMRRAEIGRHLMELSPNELIYYLNYNKTEAE